MNMNTGIGKSGEAQKGHSIEVYDAQSLCTILREYRDAKVTTLISEKGKTAWRVFIPIEDRTLIKLPPVTLTTGFERTIESLAKLREMYDREEGTLRKVRAAWKEHGREATIVIEGDKVTVGDGSLGSKPEVVKAGDELRAGIVEPCAQAESVSVNLVPSTIGLSHKERGLVHRAYRLMEDHLHSPAICATIKADIEAVLRSLCFTTSLMKKTITAKNEINDKLRVDLQQSQCDHDPYYNPEADNYFCRKCRKGMGTAYYNMAKRAEQLTANVGTLTRERDVARESLYNMAKSAEYLNAKVGTLTMERDGARESVDTIIRKYEEGICKELRQTILNKNQELEHRAGQMRELNKKHNRLEHEVQRYIQYLQEIKYTGWSEGVCEVLADLLLGKKFEGKASP